MNSKSKVFIAVFAAILMIGGALAPIMYSGNNGVTAEETTDGSSFSIVDLIEKLKEQDFDFDFGNGISLIPVGTVAAGEPEVIGTDISTEVKIDSGKVMTLTNDENKVTTFTNTGVINVKSGGTLALFMDKDKEYTYQITNNKGEGNNDVILMENGASLSILGFTFKIQTSGEAPLKLLAIGEYLKGVSGDPADLKLEYKKREDVRAAGITIYNGKVIAIANSFVAAYNGYKEEVKVGDITVKKDHPDISFIGKITIEKNTINSIGFYMVDTISPSLDGKSTDKLVQGHFNVTKGVLVANADATAKKISGSFTLNVASVNFAAYNVDYQNGVSTTPMLVINNGSVTAEKTNFNIAIKENAMDISVSRESNLVVKADSIIVNVTTAAYGKIPAMDISMTITNPTLTVDGKQASLTISMSENEVKITNAKVSTNVKSTVEKIETTVKIKTDYGKEKKIIAMTVTDASMELKGASLNYIDDKNGSLTADEITMKATVKKDAYIGGVTLDYDATIDMKVKTFNMSVNDSKITMKFNMDLSVKSKYNGKERALELKADGVIINMTIASQKTEFNSLSIDRVYLKNELSLKTFKYQNENFSALAALLGIGSGQMEIEAKKISWDGNNAPDIDYLSITMKNGVKFKEFNLQYNGKLIFNGEYNDTGGLSAWFTIAADSVNGHITGYDGNVNNFSITDAPVVGLAIDVTMYSDTEIEAESTLMIESGDARFEGGRIPFIVEFNSEGKFYANGLTAPGFLFSKNCQKSGTVVIDTNAFKLYSAMFDETGIYDGGYVYKVLLKDDEGNPLKGYKLMFNLSDMNNGTIEAKKGYELPTSYSNNSGFSMKSSDKVTGTFNIQRNAAGETTIDVPCVRKSYTLSYADNFIEPHQYKVGATVKITTDIPIKEGKEFLGWSDGSGTLYQSGANYIMPARDVKLTPVFANVVTPEVVMEGKNKTLVVDASDDLAVMIDASYLESDWTKITITVANSKVTFDKATYTAITKDSEDVAYVSFWTLKADEFNDEDIEEMVGNNQMFAINIALIDDEGKFSTNLPSNGDTKFQVTVNVFTDKAVKDMKVKYVNEYGFIEEVGVDSYKRCSDGSYDVTFTVNHFSLYAVEPIYENVVTQLFILIGLIILIAVVCIAIGAYFSKKSA